MAALPGETTMLYRIAALDERGRIAEQSVVNALGWSPGERLQFGLISNTAIAVQPDAGGMFTLARRSHIPLPVTARRWCGLRTGDRVLLAAAPDHGVLVVYTMGALDAMVAGFHASACGGEASPTSLGPSRDTNRPRSSIMCPFCGAVSRRG
ncbi:hypothetical protein [Saccharopolyspora sp. 5N708]|uniref:hypothetical protein n=1 Tax=Saccharopolyspora sp. 5N708 TaxID=3457424 RepID=UPI003FD256CB